MLYDYWIPSFALLGAVSAFPSLDTIFPRALSPSVNTTTNTSLWVITDTFAGPNFFDSWEFFTGNDPTNGLVNYVNASTAFSNGLAYVTADDHVIMKGDNTSWLPSGTYRDSVRIKSIASYNTGLFILDLNRAPWGCSIWPAFWTLGNGQWPDLGEIDIFEGVHDNEHNQVAWHTSPGCNLDPNATFTGTVVTTNGVNNTNCDGNANQNSGCAIGEWSRASYGANFDAQGGGVFAMMWDETDGISVWSFFRAAVPADITAGKPEPSTWQAPSAHLSPSFCDPLKYFVNHSMVFDITFCGDWAGNSYTTSGCPGTCADVLMNPANFVNASWSINSVKVYSKRIVTGGLTNSGARGVWATSQLLLLLTMVIAAAMRL